MNLIKMTREWYMAKGKAFPDYLGEWWQIRGRDGNEKKDAEIAQLGEELQSVRLENVALKAKFMALTHHASMAGTSGLILLKEMESLKATVEAWNLTEKVGDGLPPLWETSWVHRDIHEKISRELDTERDRANRLDRLISNEHDQWEAKMAKIDPRAIP